MTAIHPASQTSEQHPTPPSRQRGVALYIALISLVVLSLAALALVRSVDAGALVAGNLGFKKAATALSNQAAENAIGWLVDNISSTSVIYADQTAAGYYATSLDALDPTRSNSTSTSRVLVDWDDDDCADDENYTRCLEPVSSTDTDNNTIGYVILRLCASTGDPNASGNSCLKPQSSNGSSSKRGSLDYADSKRFASAALPHFRIIVRVRGARQTTSYTETIVHF